MAAVKIILSGLWMATMLTYLLGDVLRIFAGDFVAGEIDGEPVAGSMYLLPRSCCSRSSWSYCRWRCRTPRFAERASQ